MNIVKKKAYCNEWWLSSQAPIQLNKHKFKSQLPKKKRIIAQKIHSGLEEEIEQIILQLNTNICDQTVIRL